MFFCSKIFNMFITQINIIRNKNTQVSQEIIIYLVSLMITYTL